MGERTRFQMMNGCSACESAKESGPGGEQPAAFAKSFWCTKLAKPVDAKDGADCDAWKLAA